jgi:hypothetical protein
MKQVTAIGLDVAKSIFQVHGVDAAVKPGAGVLWQTATMSGWPRGLRLVDPEREPVVYDGSGIAKSPPVRDFCT